MKKYFLVNVITAFSLILGIIAVFYAIHGYLYFSFGFALLSFILDSLDGYLARRLKAESRFGAIFDTITDIVTYLIYPAVILFNAFGMNDTAGIFLIAVFLIAGVWRLIRFTANGFVTNGEKKYYAGMPVFFSHCIIMIMMIISVLDKALLRSMGPLLLGSMSILMVTRVNFRKPTSAYLGLYICIILIISVSMFFI